MRRAAVIMLMLVLWLSQAAGAASDSADTQKSQESKGITVDDLGRARPPLVIGHPLRMPTPATMARQPLDMSALRAGRPPQAVRTSCSR